MEKRAFWTEIICDSMIEAFHDIGKISYDQLRYRLPDLTEAITLIEESEEILEESKKEQSEKREEKPYQGRHYS